jgi:hypothetical protein
MDSDSDASMVSEISNEESANESPNDSADESGEVAGDESNDYSEFPDPEVDDVIQKHTDEIVDGGDDWQAVYRQLVPLMREELVGKIVETVVDTLKLKRNKFYRDIVEKHQVYLHNDEMPVEEAVERAVHDHMYMVKKMIPYHPTSDVKEMFDDTTD